MHTIRDAIVSGYFCVAAVAATAGIGACAPESPTMPPLASDAPVRFSISGDGQRGFVGELLPNPVAVQLVDSTLRPISARRPIRFSVAEGGGTVSDTIVTSDERGYASVSWALGAFVGRQHLAVSLADTPSSEQRVFADALPLSAGERIVITGATSGAIGVLLRQDDIESRYTLIWPDTVLRILPRTTEGTWEEVTAFTVGHPPAAVVRPWTSDVDTVRLAFRPPVEVPLTIWMTYDFDTTAARVQHDLARLDGAWRTHMTGLRVGRVRIDSAPGLLFQCGEAPGGGYFDPAAINVYYLNITSPYTCNAQVIRMHATHPRSFLDGYDLVLAHEVGHALSLNHVSDPGNVMWPESPPGAQLTTGQIYWMHFHNWGFLNSILGVHPAAERNCNVGTLRCPAQALSVW